MFLVVAENVFSTFTCQGLTVVNNIGTRRAPFPFVGKPTWCDVQVRGALSSASDQTTENFFYSWGLLDAS